MKRLVCRIMRRHIQLRRILLHGTYEVHDVTRCAWCKTIIDGETRKLQYPKPEKRRQVVKA